MNQMQQNDGLEPIDSILALGGPVECIDSGAIEQEELLSHARGAALSASAQSHIDECGYCRNLLAEYRDIASEPTRIGRWPLFGGLSVVAAAAAVIFAVTTTTSEVATYHVAEVTGVVQQERGAHRSKDLVFAATSQIKIVVAPEKEGSPASHIAIYSVQASGELKSADDFTIERHEDGELVSYTLSGHGADLFGAEPGNRRVAIHIANKKADASGVDASRAETKFDGQWIFVRARYLVEKQ